MSKKPKEAYDKFDMAIRLKKLLIEKADGLSERQVFETLSRMSGYSIVIIRHYFDCTMPMKADFIYWLAIWAGVSADYILGLSDEE